MSRLLAKIMLALLMLPLGGVIYIVTAMLLFDAVRMSAKEGTVFFIATLVTATFVVSYWLLLWHRSVVWSEKRLVLTVAASVAALMAGLVVGGVGESLERGFGVFIGGVTAILLWLVLTVLVWRESPAERTDRITGAGDRRAIVCPHCGYNLTGLREAACPECGSTFAVDELFAMQPGREQDEVGG